MKAEDFVQTRAAMLRAGDSIWFNDGLHVVKHIRYSTPVEGKMSVELEGLAEPMVVSAIQKVFIART